MKILILALMFYSSASFAKNYCTDQSKSVFYIKHAGAGIVSNLDVQRAELVAELPDGKLVIVPCYKNRAILSSENQIEALVVNSSKVFLPVYKESKEGFKTVGVNFVTSRVLVDRNSLIPARKYSIEFDEHL